MDASAIDAAMSALLTAIGTYGHDVLGRVEGDAADATVNLGLRLLGRFRRAKDVGARVEEAVADVAEKPDDPDFETALRAQLKKALSNDAELAADVERLLSESAVSVSSSGERSVAVANNSGIISLGDDAKNQIQR